MEITNAFLTKVPVEDIFLWQSNEVGAVTWEVFIANEVIMLKKNKETSFVFLI